MRHRDEIESNLWYNNNSYDEYCVSIRENQRIIVELLLDIRDCLKIKRTDSLKSEWEEVKKIINNS